MEKVNNTFEKGMSKDFSPGRQPTGTYLHAENIVRDVQGTVKSERGTTLLAQLDTLTNVVIIGETVIGDEIIFFLVSTEGSTIVKLKADNSIEMILHTGNGYVPTITEQSWQIGEKTPNVASEISVLDPGSPTGTLTLTLDNNTKKVTMSIAMNSNASPPMYIDVSGFTAQSSNIVVPTALMPKFGTAYIKNTWVGGRAEMGFWLSDHTIQSPIFYRAGSGGNNEFFVQDSVEYDAVGATQSSIAANVLAFQTGWPIDAVSRKNYKGEIIIYFTDFNNIPRRINTSTFIDAANFDSETKLFLNPALPRISNVELIVGGGLGTGLYNFAARLGTATGNKTTFSQLSQGFPVVDDVETVGAWNFDGAPPQTPAGKTLKISLSNVDTSYDFVELAVLTYVGEESLATAHIIGKKAVISSNMTFEYTSITQQTEEVLLEALVEDAIEYDTAKNILQKDNHLFLSNLTSTSHDGLDAEIQAWADGIEVHYHEKVVFGDAHILACETEHWSSGLVEDWSPTRNYPQVETRNDYSFRLKDSTGGAYADTYKNPDYTYRYKGYQRDEVYSLAIVPIFTGGVYGTAFHIPGDSSLGRLSNANNNASEDGTRLRGWENSDGTVHHRMPSHKKRTVFNNTQGYDVRWYLGLDFKNIEVPVALTEVIEGYAIVRQRRNKPGNGIITMQGIATSFYDGSQNVIYPGPFLGKTRFDRRKPGGGTDASGPGQNLDVAEKYFLFHSPDQEHGIINEDYFASISSIEEVALRKIKRRCDNRTTWMSPANNAIGAFWQTVDDVSSDMSYDLSGIQVKQTLDSQVHLAIAAFDGSTVVSLGLPDGKAIQVNGMAGGLVLARSSGKIHKEYTKYGDYTSYVVTYVNIPGEQHKYQVFEENDSLEIYNILSFTNNVYGELSTAEYIMCEERYLDESPGDEITVWGGDTFIIDYMYTLANRMIITSPRTVGLGFRTNLSTVIESRGNYEYRHYVPEVIEGDTTITGTLPYFPKYKELLNSDSVENSISGIWDIGLEKGTPVAYNKHYNFENTLNKYYPKDTFIDLVTTFPNRIVYSFKSFENEQFDAYRSFLTNNFHDVPKETGEITNMFEQNSILYAHTPHSLWRTFVNEKTFVNSNSGEIVLGNGGLFPIPSKQLYTEEGGFAGSSAKWASTNTPYGRIFIDNHQRKVFVLSGKGVKEITDPHLFEYFENLVDSGESENFKVGYDPLNKRAILSIIPTTTSVVGTSLSYAFELQSWSSVHTYSIDRFATRDNKLIATSGGSIYEMSTGDYSSYFGTLHPSKLQFVMNGYPSTTKDFLNLKWIQQYKHTIFSEILIKTEDFTTGPIVPILVTSFAEEQKFLSLGAQHVHKIGGEYRMTIPPDNNPEVIYTDELFRPTIKGKYGIIELTYYPDLALNSPLELEHISTEFIKIAE